MNTQFYWTQLEIPFDLGEPSSRWKCPNCKLNTVMVVKLEDKEIFLHARNMCIKQMAPEA